MSSPLSDAFPPSAGFWLQVARDGSAGERMGLASNLAAIYRKPLIRYLEAFRTGLDAEDVVHDLCAKILDPSFLADWQQSGRPFRRWLRTAARFELMNRLRAEKQRAGSGEVPTECAEPDNARQAFDRAYAASLVEAASDGVRLLLTREGRSREWDLFVAHSINGRPYAECAPPLGIAVEGARHCTERVRGLLLDALRGVLAAEQVGEAELQGELLGLLENLSP